MKTLGLFAIFVLLVIPASSQIRDRTSSGSKAPPISRAIRSTPAYAELLLRRVELESVIEELGVAYTDEFPKVRSAKFELGIIKAELVRFGKMKSSDSDRLSAALGKLLVRRAELATAHWTVSNRLSAEHPSVKKAKKRVEIFDRAIDEILKD